MSAKRKRSTSPDGKNDNKQSDGGIAIFRSEQIIDRQSTFKGFYSPIMQPKDLQRLPELANADHRILAWRRESNQQSLTAAKKYVTGYDDDGEKYGGKKIEQCLVNANLIGACVIARWWGGIMLGPVRFTHIETCALDAIQKWRDSLAEEISKKRKVEHDARETQRLAKVLSARDQSITILRALASTKEAKLRSFNKSDFTGSLTDRPSSQTVPAPEYDGMPLQRLQGLEKARDATLSFLLKRIDKAELELKKAENDQTPDD